MLHTTFALTKKASACTDRYKHLAKALGGITQYGKDTPIPLSVVLEHNGLDDALWALRCVPEGETILRDRLARLFACDCAEQALPIFEAQYPKDKRPRQAIEVARRYAEGQATVEELAAARAAAWAARDAAWAAAGAAWAARAAAWDAAQAARDAARDAALAAAGAAWAARAAAGDAAWAAAGDAEKRWQTQHLTEMLA